jgi:hypothetical protein
MACTTAMTATVAQSSPSRRFAFRRARFIAVALACAVFGGILIEIMQPERRFQTVETIAEVQIRVIPKLAPSVEALERRIFSHEALVATWNDLRAESAGGAGTAAKNEAREAEISRWRERLRIELIGEPIDDRRSVRVIWSGLNDLPLGTSIVELLAERYADDVSADRWYGSIDRLRTKIKGVEIASKTLLKSSRAEKQAEPRVSTTSTRTRPNADLPHIEVLQSAAGDASTTHFPSDSRYREFLARRAALAATMQPNHPELQAAEAAVEEAERAFASPPVVVLTSAESGSRDVASAPLLIAPNSANPLPSSASTKQAVASAGSFDDAGKRLETALQELQTQMDDVLLPREAEFPVVTLDRVGMHVGHLRPFWYAGLGLLSLVVATAVSISRTAVQVPSPQPAPIVAGPIDAGPIDEYPVAVSAEQPRAAAETPVEPTPKETLSDEAESPDVVADPYFRNEADVELRLAAPVLAVVTRRRSPAAQESEFESRRAA